MKIAISTPGAPAYANIYLSSGSEVRWALNWAHFLREQGHEVVQVHDSFSSGEVFDLYFHTTKHADVSCDKIRSLNHVHLSYGTPHRGYLMDFPCYASGSGCSVAFPHRQVFDAAAPTEAKYGYRRVYLPTPYPNSIWRPKKVSPGVDRNSITWMLKRVWHHNPNSAHEFRLDSYKQLAVWTLEAVKDLSCRAGLDLNYVEENDYGQGVLDLPPEASRLLGDMPRMVFYRHRNFMDVMDLMSKSKLIISIGGLTGSAIDAVFCGAVPLAYTNPLSFTEHVIVPLTLTTSATAGGYTLPMPKDTKKEDISALLERFWFDRDFYLAAQEKYQQDFADHTEVSAAKCFEEYLACLS